MEFQILDQTGKPVAINSVDVIAANFWKIPIQEDSYAHPIPGFGNWFDTVGWAIAANKDWTSYGVESWKSVKTYMLHIHTPALVVLTPYESGPKMHGIMYYLLPYFQLIDHFESLGFTFKQI